MFVINRMIRALNAKAEVPTRTGIKTRMENMRLKLQEELGVLLREEWVTISSDGWTSRAGDTYLGITYHFIDANWVLRSVTVDVAKLEGSTTGEEFTWKVPSAWSKREVGGVVANVTDCKTLLVFLHEAIPGGIERESYEIIDAALEIEDD